MGINYIRRDEHKHAKAGNYNNALNVTKSPLIATFDADMIPMHDFLMSLVPYFFLDKYEKCKDGTWIKLDKKKEDMKVGYVQAPQSFYNLDLFQYNLYSENKVPNEQNFFHRHIQIYRNRNNTAIYAGSNTIISREALNAIGGFYTKSITEDLATGLLIQRKGYLGYAISSVHASGLSPTDIYSLIKQRERWARGCIQTARKLNILFSKGFTFGQKSNYLLAISYWYTPLRRLVFILAPILYTLFGVTVVDTDLLSIIIFWLPQAILYNMAISKLTGNIRPSRLNSMYDITLFPSLLPSIILETIGISKKKFAVTNKDIKKSEDNKEKKYINKSIAVHMILLLLSLMGVLKCIYVSIAAKMPSNIINIFWLSVNSYYIIMALFFLFGRKSYRSSERLLININMKLMYDNESIEVKTVNISEGGAAFYCNSPVYIPEDKVIKVVMTDNGYVSKVDANIVHVEEVNNKWKYAIQFTNISNEELLNLYNILYDRVPSAPEKISNSSSFYGDLSSNIHKRLNSEVFSNRKLPRIQLDLEIDSLYNDKLVIKDFNYKYAMIKVEEGIDKDRLEFKIPECDNTIICIKEKNVGRSKGIILYKVVNYSELVYDKKFLEAIFALNLKNIEKRKEEEYLMFLNNEADSDEFLEMEFI